MRYLKQFESNNTYYTKITMDEYEDMYEEDLVEFTDNELELIENTLIPYRLVFELMNPYRAHALEFSRLTDRAHRAIEIYKLQDEYYNVCIHMMDKRGDFTHYKCDQIEGVIKLLGERI